MHRIASMSPLLPLAAVGGLLFAAENPPDLLLPSDDSPAHMLESAPIPAKQPEVAPLPEPEPGLAADAIQIRAKTIYLGDGNRIEDGVVVIEGGRILKVGRGVEVDPNVPILEHDGVLTAGMVVSHSWFGTNGRNHDASRSVLPEALVAHAYTPGHSDFKKALEMGITSMVLAPTAQNLAGGKTCVVKTSGEMFEREAHLAISFSKESLRQGVQQFGFFFEAQEPLAVDDGLESTGGPQNGGRYPTSYPGSMAKLEELMEDSEGAFASIKGGQMQVMMEAWDRNEVARAVSWAKKHNLKGALRGAPLAGELASMLKGSGLGVILGPFDAGQSTRSLKSAVDLAEAGVPLAFAGGSSGSDPASMRMSAAMAVAVGLDPVAAWKALSSDAARLAGVGDRVGRLENGMDADLVLWSGDPIDLTSSVEMVFINGKRVHGGAE